MKRMAWLLTITVGAGIAVGQSMNVHTKSGIKIYSLAQVDSITFDLSIAPGMRIISGGTFLMGQVGITSAEPVHSVTVSSFYMDTTEVTQADYLALMGVNPSGFPTVTNGPVENMTWFDAVLYCNKRSKRDGKDTVYSYTSVTGTPGDGCTDLGGLTITMTKNGYRLPTEAEWEYACRAGTTTDYYWGADAIDNYAWYSVNSGSTTHPVAGKLPNAFGLYDMNGNVWEWNNDWYGTYVAGAVTDPTGVASGSGRVFRGGSAFHDETNLRSAYRDAAAYAPGDRAACIGIRVALPIR